MKLFFSGKMGCFSLILIVFSFIGQRLIVSADPDNLSVVDELFTGIFLIAFVFSLCHLILFLFFHKEKTADIPLEVNAYKPEIEFHRAERVKDRSIKMEHEIVKIIRKYGDNLYTAKIKKTRKDAYGNIDNRNWEKEMKYFIDNIVANNIYYDPDLVSKSKVFNLIEKEIESYSRSLPSDEMDVEKLDPIKFEEYCANLLNRNGWVAETTKGSGDQGIDIVATNESYKVVFQCKKYSKPVGNKAVQEALAGKAHINASHAFVVTNSDFTESAKELAKTTKVFLIHYSELPNVLRLIKKR